MWKREVSLTALNEMTAGSMIEYVGIIFTKLNADSIEATMPVSAKTKQPFGLLHGGASVVLAETLGSVAGYLCTEGEAQVVGLEINANHLRAVREGSVRGKCQAVHLGRTHQVWQVKIFDDRDRLCCISRLTTAVLDSFK